MARLPRTVRGVLDEAIKSAEMERCAVPEEHQEAMRLYLETWGYHAAPDHRRLGRGKG